MEYFYGSRWFRLIFKKAYLLVGLSLGGLLQPCMSQSAAFTKGDTTQPQIALVFTGHAYADGGDHIREVLREAQVPGSFFFTGLFYKRFPDLIVRLRADGHYWGHILISICFTHLGKKGIVFW